MSNLKNPPIIEMLNEVYYSGMEHGPIDLILVHPEDKHEMKVWLEGYGPGIPTVLYQQYNRDLPHRKTSLYFAGVRIEACDNVEKGKPEIFKQIKE